MAHIIFLLDTTNLRHPSELLGLDSGLFWMGRGGDAGMSRGGGAGWFQQTFTSVPIADQNGREGRT